MEQKFLGIFKKKKKENSEEYEHKIIVSDFLPIVEGTLNGKKVFFLLDTGASVSMLDETQANKYGFFTKKGEDISIGGYGGVTTEVSEVSKAEIYLGSEKLNKSFLGKDIGYLIKAIHSNTGYSIVGIVGNDNISSERFVIDFKNKVIRK